MQGSATIPAGQARTWLAVRGQRLQAFQRSLGEFAIALTIPANLRLAHLRG